jgi:hypothetical protein
VICGSDGKWHQVAEKTGNVARQPFVLGQSRGVLVVRDAPTGLGLRGPSALTLHQALKVTR